ncbi:MAG: hypothetical protein HUJ51_04055 [Eggerthellaceae bacterium]|nr:hypothetical protein [Eggerthellaceae bacterium]
MCIDEKGLIVGIKGQWKENTILYVHWAYDAYKADIGVEGTAPDGLYDITAFKCDRYAIGICLFGLAVWSARQGSSLPAVARGRITNPVCKIFRKKRFL